MPQVSSRTARLFAAAGVLLGAVLFLTGGVFDIAINASTPYTVLSLLGALLFIAGRFAQRREKPTA